MLPLIYFCSSFLIIFACRALLIVQAIAFDEVSSLQVWLTVDSLARANKDKAAASSELITRQIELNWLNAPLDPDGQDYIALYLDAEPDDPLAVPVSIHRPTSASGRVTTNYYLPFFDFYNETTAQQQFKQQQEREYNQQEPPADAYQFGEGGQYSFGSSGGGSASDYNSRWHQYNSYGSPTPPYTHHRQQHQSNFETRFGDGDDERARPRRRFSEQQPTSSSPATLKLTEECLGYCVAYLDGRDRVLTRSCLRTNPTWMEESRLGSRSLTSLMIPGTHNSGTYPKHLDRTVLQMINKYQINQEESVFNQLVYGIRYLDLRVGFSKVKQRPNEELWIYHDIFRTENSVEEIFDQVRKFLEMTQHELIIMDFHRFTVGFQNENMKVQLERHEKLLNLLFNTLGDWIVPSYLGQHAPINEYIEKGKRLVVCYAGRTQLLGSQSNNNNNHHHSLLLLGPAQKQPQQVRDIDAEKQDADIQDMPGVANPADASNNNNNNNATGVQSSYQHQQQSESQQKVDRRVGTRIYNRLKTLKLISHSFSKRSIPEIKERLKFTMLSSNVYKKQQQLPTSQPERSMKVMTSSATASLQHLVADSMNAKLSLLFNSVRHIWPNSDTESGLRQFIDDSACRKYFGELRSLMAEMTPGVFGAISDQYDGIRRMSHSTNRMVTDQIRAKFLHCINLVASDYFLGNDLIRLSIYANKMRIHQQRNVELSSIGGGQCRSFRRIEHLLDKSRISQTSTNTPLSSSSSSSTSSQTTNTINAQTSQPITHHNPDKESSDLFSFFKRIFNLR